MKLRRFRDEEGRELIDLPRLPLPDGRPLLPRASYRPGTRPSSSTRAGTQILPEEFRPLVFDTKTPHSTPTFLVDGAVAGKWEVERKGKKATLALEPFAPCPAAARASSSRKASGCCASTSRTRRRIAVA